MQRTEARAQCATGRGRAGFSLVEVMVASGILLFLVLTIYESVLFCNRVAYDVKSRLAAEAIAFDTAWELYNLPLPWLKKYARAPLPPDVSGWKFVDPEDYDVWGARSGEVLVRWMILPQGSPPTNWVICTNVQWPNGTGGGHSMLPKDFRLERSKTDRNRFRDRQ